MALEGTGSTVGNGGRPLATLLRPGEPAAGQGRGRLREQLLDVETADPRKPPPFAERGQFVDLLV